MGAALLLLLGGPLPATAQSGASGYLGAGVGFGVGTMSVGPRSRSELGLVVLGEIGSSSSGHRKWFVEVAAELFEVPSPVMDEAYQAFTGLIRRSFGSDLSVTPGVGIQYRNWSGSERVEASDEGLAIGLSVAVSRRLNDSLVLLPEISWMYSGIELEGSVDASLISVRCSLVRMIR